VFSKGGGLTSLLPKLVLALAALALVGVVVPKVIGAAADLFDKEGGGSSGSGAVEYVVPEPYVLNYEPTTASIASMPSAAEGVTGFTLASDGTGYVPSMSAEQQAAVQSVLDQYAPNGRTVGFAFIDLRTGSGYAYDVDSDVYGASSFKAHVAVFACQSQAEGGAVKQSAFRQSAETAVVWSDNDAYYRLRNASGAKSEAFRSWLSGMGLDPALADDTFPTYSVREAATLWMNSYLYLGSGDPSLANWLAGLMSTTNVSMIRDGVSGDVRLAPGLAAGVLVEGASGAVFDALPDGFMTAAALEASEEAEKAAKKGEGSAVAPTGSEKSAHNDAAESVREGIANPSASPSAPSASSGSSPAGEEADPAGAYEHLGFGLDASGDVTPDIVVYNKAGWINGNTSDSTCDAGIIVEGGEAYLMVIMTSAPDSEGNRQLVSDLAGALWAARDTLQPAGLVKA